MLSCHLLIFSKPIFSKNYIMSIIRVSNSLDLDQDQHFIWPDLGTKNLQMFSADDKRISLRNILLIL